MVVLGFEGGGQEVEDFAFLWAAGLDDGQHRFDEAAAGGALGAEGEFAPDHGVAEDLFGAIIGRLNTGVGDEHPQLVPAVEEVGAERRTPRVRRPHRIFECLPQVKMDAVANQGRHRSACDCPASIRVPMVEHRAQVRQQSLADLRPVWAAIDQSLKIAFEVCPADLPLFIIIVITAIAIGTHHPAIVISEHALNGGRRASQTDPEHGVQLGRSHPQPGFVRALFGRCLVAIRGECLRQRRLYCA